MSLDYIYTVKTKVSGGHQLGVSLVCASLTPSKGCQGGVSDLTPLIGAKVKPLAVLQFHLPTGSHAVIKIKLYHLLRLNRC